MTKPTNLKSFAFFGLAALAFLGLSSCLPLAAGAAVGYAAHKEGYRVENPVRKVD